MDANRPGPEDDPTRATGGVDDGMWTFRPLDTVRIARLVGAPSGHLLRTSNGRAPRVGDIGTIVDVIKPAHGPERFVIEAVDDSGTVVWQGLFDLHELALADGAI